ncbi:biopolymer transporter ExbD [Sulfurimonas sp. MAG313]|nr:biopolymer transporter ExbD [Sulfurimonas sp. MAG313]MDF1880024.1 biopolymer transporter ExbD [Sulfurimonas sp. MAG313]
MRKNYDAFLDNEDEQGIDMTPMLDIVFIMLIFFIVTTSFVRESGIEVNKPQASTAKSKKKVNIIIGIKKSGEIWIDKHPVDIRAVRTTVERLHADTPEGTVIITADKKAQTGVLVSVMDQVKLAGIDKISIGANSDAQ